MTTSSPVTIRLLASALALTAACAGPEEYGASGTNAALTQAATPPMGWSSWNTYGCAIDEGLIRRQADALVTSGMRDLGYVFVNVDDCWMATSRDAAGDLQANPRTFPSGIAALADYVHERGLKLGIYSSPGPQTCVGRGIAGLFDERHPGSEGHEQQDAEVFARWGVDYLKYDRCTAPKEGVDERFRRMGEALLSTGRPIVYSINPDGATAPLPWSTYANLWRTTPDINPSWKKSWWSEGWWATGIIDIIDINGALDGDASPGHWNDPDMLEIGVKKSFLGRTLALTDEEGRTQLAMWAMMAAPLIAGNDLTVMTAATLATLTNREIIAVDQDVAGVQGARVVKDRDREVWVKPLAEPGTAAVALFNRGNRAQTISAKVSDLSLATDSVTLRDLWAHRDLGVRRGSFSASVPGHGVAIFVARKSAN